MEEKNVLFITLDSCRYDTALKANIPHIKALGEVKKAYTHGTYTVPAHIAFFTGHLPYILNSKKPFYSESTKQLWRIRTGASRDFKPLGLMLEKNNILEGYRKRGFYVLGTGGVSQFADTSFLRKLFNKEFMYFGPNIDEEFFQPRPLDHFPLNRVDQITNKLKKRNKWFLFMNCPETHLPYDIGNGIPKTILKHVDYINSHFNLRETDNGNVPSKKLGNELHRMQIKALESVDKKLAKLIDALPKNRDIQVVICGDHGENFGEIFAGKPRWGHLIPSKQVLEVPLMIGEIKKSK